MDATERVRTRPQVRALAVGYVGLGSGAEAVLAAGGRPTRWSWPAGITSPTATC